MVYLDLCVDSGSVNLVFWSPRQCSSDVWKDATGIWGPTRPLISIFKAARGKKGQLICIFSLILEWVIVHTNISESIHSRRRFYNSASRWLKPNDDGFNICLIIALCVHVHLWLIVLLIALKRQTVLNIHDDINVLLSPLSVFDGKIRVEHSEKEAIEKPLSFTYLSLCSRDDTTLNKWW